MKTIFSLYRAKTKQEVKRQKTACEIYSDLQEWTISKEFIECEEDSNDFDPLLEIRTAALNGEFDVLLVYEYDNVGRDTLETPFAICWFVDNNIDVVSVKYEKRSFDKEIHQLIKRYNPMNR